jgi:hypothetical protein
MEDLIKKLSHIKIDGSKIKTAEQALVHIIKSSSDIMNMKGNHFHGGCAGCNQVFDVCLNCQYYGPDWNKDDKNSVREEVRLEFYKDGRFSIKPNPNKKWFKFWEPECIYPNHDELDREIYVEASKRTEKDQTADNLQEEL